MGLGDFLKSLNPYAGAIKIGADAVGGFFTGKSNAAQAAANLAEQKRQADMQNAQAAATLALQTQAQKNAASQLDPLAQQKKRAQFAMLASLLPQFSNFTASAPGGMGKYVPQLSGGFQLPSGGFSADMMKYFSPESAANAETDFRSQTGLSNAAALSSLGYPAGTGASGGKGVVGSSTAGGPTAMDLFRERRAGMGGV